MDQVLLGNRYALGKRIGVGGMAYVYEAEDVLLKRRVAIKILKQEFVEDADFLKKFENEAQSAAALSHANIVNIYDVGEDLLDGRQLHYIVMELIEGTTLKDLIRSSKHLDNAAIIKISTQIAKALQCAHDHNIVHRDIKPANILITKNGDIKVADFGIARLSTQATITYTSSILGTVHYISPEQAKGRFIDEKSDIYSLGVVMYEMATGSVPFDAENSVGIAIKHIQEDPIPPVETNPNLYPGLNDIILTCLAKEPHERFYSCNALIDTLEGADRLQDTQKITSHIPQGRRQSRRIKEATYQTRKQQEEPVAQKKGRGIRFKLMLIVIALLAGLSTIFLISHWNSREVQNKSVKVPIIVNMDEQEAMDLLEKRDLKGSVVSRINDETVGSGVVLEQNIKAGTIVEKGTIIGFSVSLGKQEVAVPKIDNMPLDDAKQALENLGLRLGNTSYEYNNDIEKGLVIRTDPPANTDVESGERINLVISNGIQSVTTIVPTLTGLSETDAINEISASNLQLGTVSTEPSDYERGTVIRQSIAPGTQAQKQTTIDIWVSSGPAEEPVVKPQRKNFNLQLIPPEGKESFEVTVIDTNADSDQPIYQMTFSSSDANAEGFIEVTIEADASAKLSILYDGVPATTQPAHPIETVPESQQ